MPTVRGGGGRSGVLSHLGRVDSSGSKTVPVVWLDGRGTVISEVDLGMILSASGVELGFISN